MEFQIRFEAKFFSVVMRLCDFGYFVPLLLPTIDSCTVRMVTIPLVQYEDLMKNNAYKIPSICLGIM